MNLERSIPASVLGLLAATVPAIADESPWFEEVGEQAGIDFRHQSGAAGDFRFPEIMGGGVALFDYDGDGDLDLYCVQSGDLSAEAGTNPPNRLFRNNGDWVFEDVTEAAGVGNTAYGMGVACGDYDRDGDIDLYVTNVGPNALYQNQGDGTFKDITEKSKTGDGRWGTSAAFTDLDGNGFLDLFVVNNLSWTRTIETSCNNYNNERDYCSPNNYNARSTDALFLANSRGGFSNASARAGIQVVSGNGLGIACGDFDLDGDVDVYVANDATENVLWKNDGKANFTNVALAKGCAVNGNGTPEAGMGVQFVDVDMDGDLDLFMTHLRRESNTFYRNNRGRRFSDRTNMTGTNLTSLKFTGFGMGFQDFDLDGHLDLFVANGAVQSWKQEDRFSDDPYAEPNHLYRGQGGTRFEEVAGAGTAKPLIGTSRGAAFGDIDNDGDVDVVYMDRDERVKVLRNTVERKGNWVGFSVSGVKGGKLSAIVGASVRIQIDGRDIWRDADPAYSYLSSNDPRAHFGVGAAEKVTGILVRFPGGREETYPDAEPGAYHDLRLGRGTLVEKQEPK
ncbi:MAG: CRTAC1 family protein [bacterium]|nr:CRTAC1 family protein [bacterium]